MANQLHRLIHALNEDNIEADAIINDDMALLRMACTGKRLEMWLVYPLPYLAESMYATLVSIMMDPAGKLRLFDMPCSDTRH